MDIPWNVLWSRGMGWTVGHTCIYERDRWTSRGMFYGPMGWDGQWDIHASAIRTCGHPVECPMVPWDSGMGSGIHKHLREG